MFDRRGAARLTAAAAFGALSLAFPMRGRAHGLVAAVERALATPAF